ncbi:hypothetical protein ACFY05_24655 [Microtetraspora fusca]|uniref:Uncharacterized protein n=1 Tax=Microtetraspora fusca TaxID=1997 RepID=A0ABW6VA32_MICFU
MGLLVGAQREAAIGLLSEPHAQQFDGEVLPVSEVADLVDDVTVVLVMSNEAAEAPEAMRTVIAVRDEGRDDMRHMIRSSFMSEGEDAASAVADALARFGMAGFDGVSVSLQSEDGKPISEFVTPPPPEGGGFSLPSAEVGDGQALPVSNTRTISRKRFPCRVNPAVSSLYLMDQLADAMVAIGEALIAGH